MRKILFAAVAACALLAACAANAQVVGFGSGQALTGTTNTAAVDTNVYLMGTTYLCQSNKVFAANGAAQDLTGLGGFITVGAVESNIAYAITTGVATGGVFDCQFTTPIWTAYAGEMCGLQLTLTNASGTIVTYRGLWQLNITRGLH